MKALQITDTYKLEVIDLPMPEPAADEVLLRLRYVGFCGSDLNTFRGRNGMALKPVIPGHEISATVEQVGQSVPSTIRVGETVTVDPYTACGTCPSCRNRRVNACQHNETLGVQRHGAMREYICVPWQKVISADGLALRDVALIEPMSVGFHAVDRGQVTDSDTVLVIGCGMIGVGAPVTYQTAVNEVAFTGRIVCIGYSPADVSLTTKFFVQKELDIRGSRNAFPSDFRAVIRYLHRGDCPTEQLISAVVTPEKAAQAMQQWHEAPGKVFRILVEW